MGVRERIRERMNYKGKKRKVKRKIMKAKEKKTGSENKENAEVLMKNAVRR